MTQPQPKVKNPKKVEAGKKGALVKKLKKEQMEKEVERVTYSEKSEQPKKEKPPAKVIRHGNVINYALIGILTIGVGYIGYKKYIVKDENKKEDKKEKYNKLEMK